MIEGRHERMGLEGDLREISFADVVQFYNQSRRTAVLVVRAPESGEELGYFYFEHGELYDARLGDVEGLEAVYRGVALREGSFHVLGDVRAQQRRIFKPVGAILLEGIRRLDEAGRSAIHAIPQLKLVRPPTGDNGAPPEGEERAAKGELMGLVCPTCNRRFIHGDLCPHDGSKLESPADEEDPPEHTPPVSAPRKRRSPVWWVTLACGLLVIAAVAVLWVIRSGDLAAEPEEPRAAKAVAAVAPAESPRAQPVVRHLAAHGVSDDEVVFGMAAPLSGASRELGRQMKLGVETAFQQVDEAGGVHGRKLRLAALDDGYEPTRTAAAMKDLYQKQQVFGFVGNVGTPTAAVAIPFALEHKMLFYGAFTGASLLRRDPPDRYVINFRASYGEETAAVVNYLVNVRRLRPNQIAVFAQKDSYGDAGFAGVARALRSVRGDRSAILRVGYARNTIDVTEAVDTIMAHPFVIKAVVMIGTYRACARFIERMRDLKPRMIFTNVSFVGSTALAEELGLLGPRYAEGVIVTQVVPPVESHSTAVLKYRAALEKYFPGEAPDYVSLEGYLAGLVLIEALQRAGRELDTERLVDAFESMHDFDLGIGTPITFGLTEHQGSHKVWGTLLDAQGHYEVLELE
ncbi:MAG TPA: ABC transporter substrate-binding protein [Kofleriaceae bacterium]|nr:ABC transporter substrate-binding protein [Kofleriaceae bacterium]